VDWLKTVCVSIVFSLARIPGLSSGQGSHLPGSINRQRPTAATMIATPDHPQNNCFCQWGLAIC
jgi:hypothetical protein